MSASKAEESRSTFGMLNEAYEYLMHRASREMYESTLPFDDRLPSEAAIVASGFFLVLRAVFERNGKWSVTQPVPSLGGEDTPLDDVLAFYEFWFSFESWRVLVKV